MIRTFVHRWRRCPQIRGCATPSARPTANLYGMTKATQAVGAYGERLAARYLAESGMAVLERNWRCPDGEIDIIARDGDVLVFWRQHATTATRPPCTGRGYRISQPCSRSATGSRHLSARRTRTFIIT